MTDLWNGVRSLQGRKLATLRGKPFTVPVESPSGDPLSEAFRRMDQWRQSGVLDTH